MLKAIIIEDEPIAVEILEHYINETDDMMLCKVFHSDEGVLKYLSDSPVDVAFVDINLPRMSGIDLVKSFTQPPEIIFTTAYAEYAVEGFELNATDYLMKPFSYQRFVQCIDKIKSKLSYDHTLHLKSGKKIYLVKCTDVMWVEGNGDYLNVYTKDQKIMINQSLKGFLEQLPQNFFQIHRSYIINRDYIQHVEKGHVNIQGENIRIGESYREKVEQLLDLHK